MIGPGQSEARLDGAGQRYCLRNMVADGTAALQFGIQRLEDLTVQPADCGNSGAEQNIFPMFDGLTDGCRPRSD